VSSIAPTDLLSKLFCENRPVVCMIPPRLKPLESILCEMFHPLIRDQHLQIVCGVKDPGQALLRNDFFDTVHLTGSVETFRLIQEQNTFPERTFTAELGTVTPVILVPGPWSQEELLYQARHLVSLLLFNGGYNCITPQIVVLDKRWSHKAAFWAAVRSELRKHDTRDDRFAGAEERREAFRKEFPEGECFGPRTLVKLDADSSNRLFEEEAFCGMLGWVEIEADRPDGFLAQAAEFCNHKLWGDLSCLVLIDTETQKRYERQLAQTLVALEYGTIGVNVFAGLAFASGVTPWGSYLDGKADTGSGWVHNTFFFDRPEKTILQGNFIPSTPQPWVKPFCDLHLVGPALFELDLDPSALALLRFMKTYGGAMLKERRSKATE